MFATQYTINNCKAASLFSRGDFVSQLVTYCAVTMNKKIWRNTSLNSLPQAWIAHHKSKGQHWPGRKWKNWAMTVVQACWKEPEASPQVSWGLSSIRPCLVLLLVRRGDGEHGPGPPPKNHWGCSREVVWPHSTETDVLHEPGSLKHAAAWSSVGDSAAAVRLAAKFVTICCLIEKPGLWAQNSNQTTSNMTVYVSWREDIFHSEHLTTMTYPYRRCTMFLCLQQ